MKNKYLVCLLLILCLVLSACSKNITNTGNLDSGVTTTSISDDYPIYETAKKLVNASDLVFSGTIKEIKYEMLDIRTGSESATVPENSDSTNPITVSQILDLFQ